MTNLENLYTPIDDQDLHAIPSSEAEAREHILVLKREIDAISTQFANPNRTTDTGERIDSQEYWRWRHRAAVAQRYKIQRLRYLKEWLHQRNTTAKSNTPNDPSTLWAHEVADNPDALLRLAFELLRRCVNDAEIIFTSREQETFETIRSYLRRAKVPGERRTDWIR